MLLSRDVDGVTLCSFLLLDRFSLTRYTSCWSKQEVMRWNFSLWFIDDTTHTKLSASEGFLSVENAKNA